MLKLECHGKGTCLSLVLHQIPRRRNASTAARGDRIPRRAPADDATPALAGNISDTRDRGAVHPDRRERVEGGYAATACTRRRQSMQTCRAVSTRRNTLTALEIVLGVDALPGFARPAPLLRDSARGVTALTHPAPGRRSVVRCCRTLFRSYGDGAGAGRLALATADGVRAGAGAVSHGVEHEAVPTGVAANVVGRTDGDSVVWIYAGAAVSGNLEVYGG